MANKQQIKSKSSPKKTDSIKSIKSIRSKTFSDFFVRILIFSIIVSAIVYFTDKKGYFNPDYTNDHTRRKWNAYYDFVKRQPVDVILVGNSHLYTGLNPDNLSNTLGANCFILASPGTTLTDTYFCLKEAITVNKPKIAVVETFTINGYHNRELKAGQLSDQFKSFSARKNIIQKLYSTPLLFSSDNYVSAWSNTIRNHSFIFNDTAQIRKNRSYVEPEQNGLYLGRYNRFMTGIEDTTLLKYNRPGFIAYDYGKNIASDEARKYLKKIIRLCYENNVQLVFLTLPMYYRHVHDYDAYKKDLLTVMEKSPWIDMQQPYDTVAFTSACFENTVSGNQHMTYYGARVAAYKLASYLKANFAHLLPGRYSDIEWKRLFYASDGYFENYPPENDGVSQLLLQNVTVPGGVTIKEMSFVPNSGAKSLIVKVDKNNVPPMYGKTMHTMTQVALNGQKTIIEIKSMCTLAYAPDKFYVFVSEPLNPGITIEKIESTRISEN
ncbi:MAG: hypothetical protein QM751_13330 [Paludibacteraceae bacterium]